MNSFDYIEKGILKGMEHSIKLGHLSKNPLIRLESVAQDIARCVHTEQEEEEKSKELNTMFDIMNRHMPEMFQKILKGK